jgi:hypothetical protein
MERKGKERKGKERERSRRVLKGIGQRKGREGTYVASFSKSCVSNFAGLHDDFVVGII